MINAWPGGVCGVIKLHNLLIVLVIAQKFVQWLSANNNICKAYKIDVTVKQFIAV